MIEFRLLDLADAAAFKTLRLAAIDNAPTAVWPTREEEAAASLDACAARIRTTPNQAVVGVWIDGVLAGITGVRREPFVQVSHQALIWGVFVDAARRGQGFARRLVDAAIEHAAANWGVVQIKLCVNTENVAAKTLYESLGFVTFGIEARSMRVAGRFYDEAHMVKKLD
jgi:ribosomal protein S18 acetylase RimI-like enzyme